MRLGILGVKYINEGCTSEPKALFSNIQWNTKSLHAFDN